MLIKPFFSDPYEGGEDLQVLKFNTAKGNLNNVRNTMYIKAAGEKTSNSVIGNEEVFDVILVSDMIKAFDIKNYANAFNAAFLLEWYDCCNIYDLNVYGKIVHYFNGIYRGDPTADMKTKLANMSLYPNISYSTFKKDNMVEPVSKVLYMKHGMRILSNVCYTHKSAASAYEYDYQRYQQLDNCGYPKAIKIPLNALNGVIEDLVRLNAFMDITDPKYPDIQPYTTGTYPRCLEIKSMYTGSELTSELQNLTVNIVTLHHDEEEERNRRIRMELMGIDAGSAMPDTLMRKIDLRMAARNIAVDFTKVSICAMFENAEIVLDNRSPDVSINKLRVPFSKLPTYLMLSMMSVFNSDVVDIVAPAVEKTLENPSEHVKVYIWDTPFEIIVKITNFDLKMTETVRLDKSEAIHTYLIEGLHNPNEEKFEIHRNVELLENSNNNLNQD